MTSIAWAIFHIRKCRGGVVKTSVLQSTASSRDWKMRFSFIRNFLERFHSKFARKNNIGFSETMFFVITVFALIPTACVNAQAYHPLWQHARFKKKNCIVWSLVYGLCSSQKCHSKTEECFQEYRWLCPRMWRGNLQNIKEFCKDFLTILKPLRRKLLIRQTALFHAFLS